MIALQDVHRYLVWMALFMAVRDLVVLPVDLSFWVKLSEVGYRA